MASLSLASSSCFRRSPSETIEVTQRPPQSRSQGRRTSSKLLDRLEQAGDVLLYQPSSLLDAFGFLYDGMKFGGALVEVLVVLGNTDDLSIELVMLDLFIFDLRLELLDALGEL